MVTALETVRKPRAAGVEEGTDKTKTEKDIDQNKDKMTVGKTHQHWHL